MTNKLQTAGTGLAPIAALVLGATSGTGGLRMASEAPSAALQTKTDSAPTSISTAAKRCSAATLCWAQRGPHTRITSYSCTDSNGAGGGDNAISVQCLQAGIHLLCDSSSSPPVSPLGSVDSGDNGVADSSGCCDPVSSCLSGSSLSEQSWDAAVSGCSSDCSGGREEADSEADVDPERWEEVEKVEEEEREVEEQGQQHGRNSPRCRWAVVPACEGVGTLSRTSSCPRGAVPHAIAAASEGIDEVAPVALVDCSLWELELEAELAAEAEADGRHVRGGWTQAGWPQPPDFSPVSVLSPSALDTYVGRAWLREPHVVSLLRRVVVAALFEEDE